MACLVLLGLVVHGVGASRLGLYWDDTEFLMLGMQKANSDAAQFVFTDMPGLLTRERPFQCFTWAMARAAFVLGLPALHWMLVAFLILNVVLLAIIVQRLVGEAWFTFSAGMVFMVYPLSPLQAIWPSLIHYLWASLWALLSIVCCLNSIQSKGQLKWTVLAALSYLASLLSHEGTVLIPPTFIALHLVFSIWSRHDVSKPSPQESSHLPAVKLGIALLFTLLTYGAWRKMILPLYGLEDYVSSEVNFNPTIIATNAGKAAETILFPWADAIRQVFDWRPEPWCFLLSMFLAVVSGALTFILGKHSASSHSAGSRSQQMVKTGQWLWAASVGFSLILAALFIVGISPPPLVPGRVLGGNMFSRLYFAATIGVAVALPPLCLLAVRFYSQAPRLISALALCCLFLFGFVFFPLSGNILTHRSELPQVFGRYSETYATGVIGYVLAIVFLFTLLYFSWRRRIQWFGLVAAIMAALVMVGSLYQFSVKQQYADRWRQQIAMLQELKGQAPSLQDGTFVLVDDPQDHLPFSHYELSGFLVVLYDNWTLMANREHYARFFSDGVESSHYNYPVFWRPPDNIGPLTETYIRGKSLPLGRISYDRLLIFSFDGSHLRLLPSKEVVTKDGQRVTVQSHPERILSGPPVRATVWRHITSSIPFADTGFASTH